MKSIHADQLSDKQSRLLNFVNSETEKIFMPIWAEEIIRVKFMRRNLEMIAKPKNSFVFNYEIWPQEHSRHFLYRWLNETVSGSACFASEEWLAFNVTNPQLKKQLKLMREKDRRPLEIRFLEAIRFIAENLEAEQCLLLNFAPLTDVDDPTLADFFKSILRLLPAKTKMIINQCVKDVLTLQDDFCPSNRINIIGGESQEVENLLEQYYECYHNKGVMGSLMRTLVHVSHPLSINELVEFTGIPENEIKKTLESAQFEAMVATIGKQELRMAYPRLFFPKIDDVRKSLAVDMADFDLKALAYYQDHLSQRPDSKTALYHSLGVYRLTDADAMAEHSLACYRTKLKIGAGEMSEIELERAFERVADGQDTTRAQLLLALAEIRETLGRNNEALEVLKTAIELLQKTDRKTDLQFAFELKGRAAFALREIKVAQKAFEESLSLARDLEQGALIADILSQSGYLHYSIRKLDVAEKFYQEALDQYRDLSHTEPNQSRRGMASQWSNLGHVGYAGNDFEKAEKCHRKAMDIYTSLADERQMANQWGYLGHTFFAAKQYDKAVKAYEQAAEYDENSGNAIMAAQRYSNMGHAMYAQREPKLAYRFFNKALNQYKALSNAEGEASQLSNLGLVKGDQGEFDQAVGYFNKAKNIYDEMGDQINAVTQITRLGHIRRGQNDLKAAKKHYQEALDRYHSLDYALGEGDTAMELGQVNAAMQDFNASVQNYSRAQLLFKKLGHKEKEAMCLVLLGQACKSQGDFKKCEANFNNAMDMYKQMENPLGLANVFFQIGLLQFDNKNYSQAEKHYNDALEIFKNKGDADGEASILANLGTLHYQTKHLDQAYNEFNRALDLLRKMQHPIGLAGVLVNLSFVHEDKHQYSDAHNCLKEALGIYHEFKLSKETAAIEQRLTTLEHKADLSLKNMRGEMLSPTSDKPVKDGKVKRNAPCPCGSGKKSKKCCYR